MTTRSERSNTSLHQPGGAPDLLLAVQRLGNAIRCNLPLIGEPVRPPWEVPVFCCDLGDDISALPILRLFSDLLNDPPDNCGPDGLIRKSPALQNVGPALREVHRLMETLPKEAGRHLRELLRDLSNAPLYWFHLAGWQAAERDLKGGVRPAPWLPIRQGFSPVDGGLLQNIQEAAADLRLSGRTEPEAETDLATLAALIGDDKAAAIFAVGRDKSKTVEQRQCDIYILDNRVVGWDGNQWAKLLGVSPQAARQTAWWKTDRPRLRGTD